MIYKSGYCHTLCLVNVLAGFLEVSGAGNYQKSVCPGDSVDVFQNITFNNCSSVVSLYINGERNTLIARWSFKKCSRNETLLPDYNERVFLYGNGTISIHNVHPWDQEKYVVNCQLGDKSIKYEVEIKVMAAPANDCIPKITRAGRSLFAYLEARSCGKPAVTLYWKGYGDVPNTYEPVLKPDPGNQDGTYYACIEGPALQCARNALDYCSSITIGVSGGGNYPKYVCPGDSVDAFQNITFNNCSSVVSLYINNERNTLIARWSFENCSQNETRLPDYNERVFLYGNGTISIHNVQPWDQEKYVVICQLGDESIKYEVEINVMAAPANDCIPKIMRVGSSLFAELEDRSCGKPAVTLYWKGYGDVPNTYEPVLKPDPGNQDGTYYACIEGPALKCVRNARYYCSNITTGDKSPPTPSVTSDVKKAIFIVVGIVLGISPLILAIAVILFRKRCRKKTSSPLKRAVVHRQANGYVRLKFNDNEGSTEGREVNDRNSEPGSSRAIIGSEDQSDSGQGGNRNNQ